MGKKELIITTLSPVWLVLAMGLSACVDRDYDLSNDVDLTITFGGDSLFVPGGSTEELTMDKILDIDDESSVMAANEDDYGMMEGDYYLYGDNAAAENHSTITTDGTIVSGTVVDFDDQSVLSSGLIPVYTSHFTMNDDVSPTIVEIDEATTDCRVDIYFTSSSSGMTLENGFSIEFPSYIRLGNSNVDANADRYTVSGNSIVVTQSIALPVTLVVNASAVDLTASQNEVTFTRGDKETDTKGYIELQGDISVGGDVGVVSSSLLNTQIVINDMTLESIYGIIDPDIDITVDPISFNDVPDVLQDEDTNLDWTNPQIYITVENPTELSVNFSQIRVTSYYDNKDDASTKELVMGTGMSNTQGEILVGTDTSGDGFTVCISQIGAPIEVDNDVKVTNLSDFIRQIPDRIEITDIVANAVQRKCWVDLDTVYDLGISYEMVAPLSFGSELIIAYKDTIDGWHQDLKDVKRANEVQAMFSIVNKVPLELTLSAVAIDTQGNEIPDDEIKCTVVPEQKAIAQGSIDVPVVSDATVSIEAKDGDISQLDGIIVRLTSTEGDNSSATINKHQSIKLENVRLLLVGGITIDLN